MKHDRIGAANLILILYTLFWLGIGICAGLVISTWR